MDSGITRRGREPLTAPVRARPMPVLPDVGSMITESLLRMPRCSASSIMATPMRSLMLPPGFARSILVQTVTRGSNSLLLRTCGVLPPVSTPLSKITWTVPFPCMPGAVGRRRSPARSDDEVDGIGHLRDGPDPDLALVVHERPCRPRRGQPHVPADDGVGADDRVSPEDGRVRVDHDPI